MAMAVSVPRYTLADLERFPDDGNRYELLDGVLIATPSPSRAHGWPNCRSLPRHMGRTGSVGWRQSPIRSPTRD